MLSQEHLKTILDYDPFTGIFYWKRGRLAGCVNGKGYRQILIEGKIYQEHRLAFLWMTGAWPDKHVDHINHVTDDNRWENLREVTRSENQQNRKKLGGVFQRKDCERWQAQIQVDGKRIYLGLFEDENLARAAYLAAKEQYHAKVLKNA